MPIRKTQTPEGIPGFNNNICSVCGKVQYRKKLFEMPDGTLRCKKHRNTGVDALFDASEFTQKDFTV